MAKRSPIRGYNHNVSYRGVVFHVQTEDSGVDNPHIFTHLFYGGIIVSSRKLDYAADSAEESIKALMQAQHKAVLKILTRGGFDDKIDAYLVDVAELLPQGASAAAAEDDPEEAVVSAAPVAEPPPSRPSVPRMSTLSPELLEQLEPPTDPAGRTLRDSARTLPDLPRIVGGEPAVRPTGRTEQDLPTVHFRRPASTPSPHESSAEILSDDDVAEIHSPPPMPGVSPGMRPPSRPGSKPPPVPRGRPRPVTPRAGRTSDVIVSRPSVIVGGSPGMAAQDGGKRRRPRVSRRDDTMDGLFGGDLISEKSLDEVILAYLSEDSDE